MKKIALYSLPVILVLVFSSFRKTSTTFHGTWVDGIKTIPSSFLPVGLETDTIQYPEETHLRNVQQLTFGGDNAEAYWSYDSKYIVFQRTNPKEGLNCDQIFMGKAPQKPGDKFE